MATRIAKYQFNDGAKLGYTGSGQAGLPATPWAPATVYAAGAVAENGGFVFQTAAGGISAAFVAGTTQGPTPVVLTDNTVTWVLKGFSSALCTQDTVDSNSGQPRHELGIIAIGKDISNNGYGEAEFMYVKFSGIVVPGDFVYVNQQNFVAQQIPAAILAAQRGFGKIAITMGAQVVGSYGWVMVRGIHDCANVATASATADSVLAGAGVAGRAMANPAALTANYILDGARLNAVFTVLGLANVELYYAYHSGRA
jgi:hypothetical protein